MAFRRAWGNPKPACRSLAPSVLCAAVLILVLACAGCGRKHYGAVQFDSTPDDAEVLNLKNGAFLGRTPLLVILENGSGEPEYVTVRLRKEGYAEEIRSFWLNARYESPEDAREDPWLLDVSLKARE